MLQSSPSASGLSIPLIEGSLTLIAVAVSFAWPKLGSGWFASIERLFGKLARRRVLSVIFVGLSALLLRMAFLPLFPIPLPFIPDDFSFLLAADTFAHGRLTNPTPAMWVHFESLQIDMKPTYTSMYFPGPGLVLAAGKVLLGHPWFGLLIANALMCAAICWMLQAWLPAGWALLGGILAVLRISLFSYWINTYTGGGAVSALGGALVLGALPRFMRHARFRHAMLLAIGIVLLAYTRPYEGMLLCLPVAAALGHWLIKEKNRPSALVLLKRAAVPLALLIAAAAWLGYYNYRAFGSPLTLPYTINRDTYAATPYYIWQSLRPEPVYRHIEMRNFYDRHELALYHEAHSLYRFVPFSITKAIAVVCFFAGFALLIPILMLRRTLLDHRVRFLVLCLLLLAAGMSIEIFLLAHYTAPFTVAFYAVGLQAMRHLRVWAPEGRAVGKGLVRMSIAICVIMAALRGFGQFLPFPSDRSQGARGFWWYGPDHAGVERAKTEQKLEMLPGNKLLLVRYSPTHDGIDEWVYNAADIDHSKVIWAHAMSPTSDQELVNHYQDRHVWLVEPDAQPVRVTPYPSAAQLTMASQQSLAAK